VIDTLHFKPWFCDNCGAKWLLATCPVILPKEYICAFGHRDPNMSNGVITDRWVKWDKTQNKFIEEKT